MNTLNPPTIRPLHHRLATLSLALLCEMVTSVHADTSTFDPNLANNSATVTGKRKTK
jgi:hypothetical protein